jgi:hypothetical protein
MRLASGPGRARRSHQASMRAARRPHRSSRCVVDNVQANCLSGHGFAGTEGFEPSTIGVGDQRSTVELRPSDIRAGEMSDRPPGGPGGGAFAAASSLYVGTIHPVAPSIRFEHRAFCPSCSALGDQVFTVSSSYGRRCFPRHFSVCGTCQENANLYLSRPPGSDDWSQGSDIAELRRSPDRLHKLDQEPADAITIAIRLTPAAGGGGPGHGGPRPG